METVNRIPFRRMREALRTAVAQTALLLAVESLNWPQTDYALFFIMTQNWDKTENPTYPQMMG